MSTTLRTLCFYWIPYFISLFYIFNDSKFVYWNEIWFVRLSCLSVLWEKDGRWCRCKHLPNRVTVFLFARLSCPRECSKIIVSMIPNLSRCSPAWFVVVLIIICFYICRVKYIIFVVALLSWLSRGYVLAFVFWFYLRTIYELFDELLSWMSREWL